MEQTVKLADVLVDLTLLDLSHIQSHGSGSDYVVYSPTFNMSIKIEMITDYTTYAYVMFEELQRRAWARYFTYETGPQDGLVHEPLSIRPAAIRRRRRLIEGSEQNKRYRLF